jgi:hypothetical protein
MNYLNEKAPYKMLPNISRSVVEGDWMEVIRRSNLEVYGRRIGIHKAGSLTLRILRHAELRRIGDLGSGVIQDLIKSLQERAPQASSDTVRANVNGVNVGTNQSILTLSIKPNTQLVDEREAARQAVLDVTGQHIQPSETFFWDIGIATMASGKKRDVIDAINLMERIVPHEVILSPSVMRTGE